MNIQLNDPFSVLLSNAPIKLDRSEIEKLIDSLAQQTLSQIKQTKACYFGSNSEIDPGIKRPKNFIGPLEHELLPDSAERRLMWLSALVLQKNDFIEFLSKIPYIKIVQRVDSPELLYFSRTQVTKIDCFNKALKDDAFYKEAIKSPQSYGRMRSLAFGKNPLPLLKIMGYTQVEKGAFGDLIVYFTNVRPGKEELPSYQERRTPGHYGRIIEITKEGDVIVESKFNDSHIFHHRIDLIPYFFGNSFLIFSKKLVNKTP